MKQITKITLALALIISLASCQSSISGCYNFGDVGTKVTKNEVNKLNTGIIFTTVKCKP